jgi:hypothetical protein
MVGECTTPARTPLAARLLEHLGAFLSARLLEVGLLRSQAGWPRLAGRFGR